MGENVRVVLALMACEGMEPQDLIELRAWSETVGGSVAALEPMARTRAGRRQLSEILQKQVGSFECAKFDEEIKRARSASAQVVTVFDTSYPDPFRELHQPPPMIFARGDLNLLQQPGIGVVGTRKPSTNGAAFARRLGRDLAAAGIHVISGLARGIDTSAHIGALDGRGNVPGDGRGRPVAVIGTGIDIPYPPENAGLHVDVAEAGCVVSEQLPGTPPLRHVFPARNRLISALSLAVIVVEGSRRSGALITARWALEQGRDIGAVPGFPGDFRSAGPNHLLRQGAFVVESVADVVAAIPMLGIALTESTTAEPSQVILPLPDDASETVRKVFAALTLMPVDPDQLSHQAGVELSVLNDVLTRLEINGLALRDAAGRFSRHSPE